jgi:dethiobiotin synthetase
LSTQAKFEVSRLAAKWGGARGVFVTGTDTGVGKTFVAARMIRALAREGLRVAGMKPVAAGAHRTSEGLLRNGDALALAAASNVSIPYEIINPYCFLAPVSPHIAAGDEGVTIETRVILGHFEKLSTLADFIVVEGAGGWFVPISPSQTMADVALALSLPVLLVVGLRLGCLNHSLLSQRAIEASGAEFAGWIGNGITPKLDRAAENLATLESLLRCAPLGVFEFDRGATAKA